MMRSADRFAHEPKPDPAGLTPVLYLDPPVFGHDVAHGRNRVALARGTPTLARLRQLGLAPHGGGIAGSTAGEAREARARAERLADRPTPSHYVRLRNAGRASPTGA